MTQQPVDQAESAKAKELLARLEGTAASSLKAGVAKVEGLSKSDEENHGRWIKSKRKQIFLKLTTWFLHFLFSVVCLLVLFVVVGTCLLTILWVQSFLDKPDEIHGLLSQIWQVALVAMATLFVQNIWPKD